MVGPAAKREAVAHLQTVMGLSERRACSFVGADRKMIRYQSCRPPEIELRGRLRELANERRRFGYRRLFVLLRREGERSGINRISLWKSPEFGDAMKNAGDNFVQAALESLEHDTDVEWRPRVPQWPAIGEAMATAIQSALVGQKDAKSALDEAQARIEQLLGKK